MVIIENIIKNFSIISNNYKILLYFSIILLHKKFLEFSFAAIPNSLYFLFAKD